MAHLIFQYITDIRKDKHVIWLDRLNTVRRSKNGERM